MFVKFICSYLSTLFIFLAIIKQNDVCQNSCFQYCGHDMNIFVQKNHSFGHNKIKLCKLCIFNISNFSFFSQFPPHITCGPIDREGSINCFGTHGTKNSETGKRALIAHDSLSG